MSAAALKSVPGSSHSSSYGFSYNCTYASGIGSAGIGSSSSSSSSSSKKNARESRIIHTPLPFTPPSSALSSKSLPLTLPFHAPLRAHQLIGIYHDQYHIGSLYFALSAESPPISYVTVQRVLHGPTVSLHLTGSPSSPTIATAEYNNSSAVELKTAAPTSAQRGMSETMDRTTCWSSAWALNIFVPSSGCKERFEWRCNAGPDGSCLVSKAKGLELVRVRTGEVVAAYGRTSMSARKTGKFSWRSEDWYGEEGDMMVLISLLALTEKMRRGELELD